MSRRRFAGLQAYRLCIDERSARASVLLLSGPAERRTPEKGKTHRPHATARPKVKIHPMAKHTLMPHATKDEPPKSQQPGCGRSNITKVKKRKKETSDGSSGRTSGGPARRPLTLQLFLKSQPFCSRTLKARNADDLMRNL